jgi:hypothetical protein
MVGRVFRNLPLLAFGVFSACGVIETGYFQGQVNQATQDIVYKRYGAPHKLEKLPDGGSVWTYFDRGSGTSGYSGYVRTSYCRAYIMTFDQTEVLRDWKREDCATRPATITDPFSDRK